MRTPSTQETNLFESSDYVTCIKMEVDRSGSGDYQNMNDFYGYDWLIGVTYKEDVDSPVASMDVTFASRVGEYSLSPYVENSLLNQFGGGYTPALALGRRIKLYAARIPHSMEPVASDWHLVFEGFIDEIDPVSSDDEVIVKARNQGSILQDLFIETTQTYGADASPFEPVEDVMQDVIDDNLGSGVVTLYTPSSPSWNVMRYSQQREPVLDALRNLAAQIGWDVRYKWWAGTGEFRLTFFEIDRTKSTPDRTYTADQILAFRQMTMKIADIRNAVRVVYTPISTQDRTSVLVTDATSIANYGRRYFEAAEASASNIDTSTEANLMANAILADLKDPAINHAITVPYSYETEIGDLYRFTADGVHFDSDLDAAVVGYTHTIKNGRANTQLQLRGKPSGRFLGWLRMEARSGVAPIGAIDRPGTATSGAIVQTPTGIQITYDDPSANMPVKDWAYSEFHVSKTSGFTPSIATEYGRAKTTTFTFSGLAPRTTYYIKIIVVDSWGNRSLASSQQYTTAPIFVPGTIDYTEDRSQILPNGEFHIWDPGADPTTTPPSGWSPVEYTLSTNLLDVDEDNSNGWWGSSGQVYFIDSSTFSGDKAIKVNSDTNQIGYGLLCNEYFSVTNIDTLETVAVTLNSLAFASGRTVSASYVVEFYNAAKTRLDTVLLTYKSDTGSDWMQSPRPIQIGNYVYNSSLSNTVRWARFGVIGFTDTTPSTDYALFDSAHLYRVVPKYTGVASDGSPTISVSSGSNYRNQSYFYSPVWSMSNMSPHQIYRAGSYVVEAIMVTDDLTDGKELSVDIVLIRSSTYYYQSGVTVYGSTGDDRTAAPRAVVDLEPGDEITLNFTHDNATNLEFDVHSTLSMRLLER